MLDPLTYIQAKVVIESISYKPGWKIEAKPGYDPRSVELTITHREIDSTHPTPRDTDVSFSLVFGRAYMQTEEELLLFVRQAITQAELHERDEWFRFKGELVDDPHRPGRNGIAEISLPA